MKELVCVTGLTGSGKSVASDYFVEKGFQYLRFGQVVMDELVKRNLPVNEKNERFVREDLRKEYGMAAMAILNLSKFKTMLKSGNVIGDGLYSFEEYKVLKKEFAEKFIVIAVFAPPKLRYKHLSERKLVAGDKDVRNRPLTPEEAESRDFAEIENLNKGGTIAMADFTLLNTGSLKFLKKQIKETFNEIKKENK